MLPVLSCFFCSVRAEAPLGGICISRIPFIFSSNIPYHCNYSVLYFYNDKICEYVGDGQNIALLTFFSELPGELYTHISQKCQ